MQGKYSHHLSMMNTSLQRHVVHRAVVRDRLLERNGTALPGACTLRPQLIAAANATEILRLHQLLMQTSVGAYTVCLSITSC